MNYLEQWIKGEESPSITVKLEQRSLIMLGIMLVAVGAVWTIFSVLARQK